MVELTVVYQGELRCQATHGPSGATLLTDAPADNHGKAATFSPTDLVATALGTCILTIMGILAERHHFDLSSATVKVTKYMVTTPVRRVGRLPVEITVPAPLTVEHQQMLERAVRTCPVHQSLHPDIDAPLIFHWATKS